MQKKLRGIGLSSKIFFVVSGLVVIALLLQGGIFRRMVQKEIKKNALELLSRETSARVSWLNDIVKQIGEDLAIMQAHKAIEDYFTSLAFDDTEGMTDATSTLEPFFVRIFQAKPQYTRTQITTAQAKGVLQLVNGNRVEKFDQFNDNEALSKLKSLPAANQKIIHTALYDKNDGWVILSTAAIIFEGKIEGLLRLYRPVNDELFGMLSNLKSSGLSCALSDLKGNTVVHSQEMNENVVAGFKHENLTGWLLASKEIQYLDWKIHLGIEKSNAYIVLRKITITAFIVIIVSVMAVSLLIWLVIRSITTPVNRITRSLDESAGEIAAASDQISSSSQQTAQGASEQAAAIEETSSSLEEMSSMTKRNAEHADQANILMKKANQVVDQANQSMTDLTASIQEISKASDQTSKIIKTIDEIAFQTNLLALNAAVEAARAGEAGAGFAVVADEVRNLAMRAADAAKNTAALIEGTVNKINNGSESVARTSEAFTQVAEGVCKVSELVSEIAAASKEQAQGTEQVNNAVTAMDKVTQQNAANAEESASASEEMNAQAEQMKMIIEELTNLVGAGTTGVRRGPAQRIDSSHDQIHVDLATPLKRIQKLPARKAKVVSPDKIIPLEDSFKDF